MARREMQGPRPAPLKISKDSHKIRKPVIIYTQSPKIIHIEARNFMTLVQRLTGSSSTEEGVDHNDSKEDLPSDAAGSCCSMDNNTNTTSAECCDKQDEVEKVDSGVTSTATETGEGDSMRIPSAPGFSPLTPHFFSPSPRLLSPSIFQDIPLFTPSFDSFFYSPGHFYRFSEPIMTPSQRPSALDAPPMVSPSPTACDLFKTLPEC